MTYVSLAAESQTEAGLPAEAVGLITLAILLGLLIITLVFGKGRPHA